MDFKVERILTWVGFGLQVMGMITLILVMLLLGHSELRYSNYVDLEILYLFEQSVPLSLTMMMITLILVVIALILMKRNTVASAVCLIIAGVIVIFGVGIFWLIAGIMLIVKLNKKSKRNNQDTQRENTYVDSDDALTDVEMSQEIKQASYIAGHTENVSERYISARVLSWIGVGFQGITVLVELFLILVIIGPYRQDPTRTTSEAAVIMLVFLILIPIVISSFMLYLAIRSILLAKTDAKRSGIKLIVMSIISIAVSGPSMIVWGPIIFFRSGIFWLIAGIIFVIKASKKAE